MSCGTLQTAGVWAAYESGSNYNNTFSQSSMISLIASAFTRISVLVDQATATSAITDAIGAIGIGGTSSSTEPAAYLNHYVFDKNLNFKFGGYTKTVNSNQGIMKQFTINDITITEPGYILVFLSNESNASQRVFFDELTVTLTQPIIQVDDYYPFGLSISGLSATRENSLINKWKFQGQELLDDFDLNWYAFKWRNHDPAIGRFFNVDPLAMDYVYNSPYAFSENQVTAHVELEGLEKAKINVEGDVILPASDHHRINEEYIDEEFKDLHVIEPDNSLPDLSLDITVTVGPQVGVKVGNIAEADLTIGNIEVLKDKTTLDKGEIKSEKQIGPWVATPDGINDNGKMKIENSAGFQIFGFGGKIGQKQNLDGSGSSSDYNTFTETSINRGGLSGTEIIETDNSGKKKEIRENSFSIGAKFVVGVELKLTVH